MLFNMLLLCFIVAFLVFVWIIVKAELDKHNPLVMGKTYMLRNEHTNATFLGDRCYSFNYIITKKDGTIKTAAEIGDTDCPRLGAQLTLTSSVKRLTNSSGKVVTGFVTTIHLDQNTVMGGYNCRIVHFTDSHGIQYQWSSFTPIE